ncbi:hypothetical protein [Pseudomonas sp. S2_E02]
MPKYLSLKINKPINRWGLAYGLALISSVLAGVILFSANNTTKTTKLPLQENYIPELKANFDTCEIGAFWISASGWALLDLPDNTIKIHLYARGDGGAIKLLTRRIYRKDVSDFLKIKSDFHLHGFHATGIRRNLQAYYGKSLELYVEDSKGVMHYGGANVCTGK